jgi:hypothetical protein
MPKKTRKAKIRASQRPINVGYAPAAPAPTRTVESTRESFAPRSASVGAPTLSRSVAPVTSDYGYVFRDLKRIGLLALTFFVIMFVLWFLVEVQGVHIIPGIL